MILKEVWKRDCSWPFEEPSAFLSFQRTSLVLVLISCKTCFESPRSFFMSNDGEVIDNVMPELPANIKFENSISYNRTSDVYYLTDGEYIFEYSINEQNKQNTRYLFRTDKTINSVMSGLNNIVFYSSFNYIGFYNTSYNVTRIDTSVQQSQGMTISWNPIAQESADNMIYDFGYGYHIFTTKYIPVKNAKSYLVCVGFNIRRDSYTINILDPLKKSLLATYWLGEGQYLECEAFYDKCLYVLLADQRRTLHIGNNPQYDPSGWLRTFIFDTKSRKIHALHKQVTDFSSQWIIIPLTKPVFILPTLIMNSMQKHSNSDNQLFFNLEISKAASNKKKKYFISATGMGWCHSQIYRLQGPHENMFLHITCEEENKQNLILHEIFYQ